MSYPASTDLGEGEQAGPSSNNKPGPSPSPDINQSEMSLAIGPTQDERELSLPTRLKHQTGLPPLAVNTLLDLEEQPKREAADVSDGDDETTKLTFADIPAELRLKVYKMSWDPRRVTLSRSWLAGPENLSESEFFSRISDESIYSSFLNTDLATVSTSNAQLPVTLWVNKESRYETLRHYKIAFASSRNGSSNVYFNFAIDELEIPRHGPLNKFLSREDLVRIKALILPVGIKDARSAVNTLDKLRHMPQIEDVDGKVDQLHNLGLASGLEPYDPKSSFEDAQLRRLAEDLQQEITQAFDLPPKLSSVCPSLERLQLESTVSCRDWPARDFATLYDEEDWFMMGNCRCFTCNLHWSARHVGFLVADDPDQQAWSVGDVCPPELGRAREMRMGKVTVAWRARVDDAASLDPEDERRTRRTVADWALAAADVANHLADCDEDEPFYAI